jgi:peptidoglycan hydrolase-like protein with peptidoglycan-binding domain
MAVYRRRSKGTEVENIQARLKQLGYYKGSADGKFGSGTEKAVKALQRARQLEVDGKVGPATWRALFEEPKKPESMVASAGVVATPVTSGPSEGAGLTAPNPYARLNDQRLSHVHPVLAIRGRSLLELCAYENIAVLITQGLRTWEEQDALYAQGRTAGTKGKIVTKAKGGSSFHNFGLAFDIVVLDSLGKADWDASHPSWKRAAEIGKSVGLEWGGDWKSFKDIPHFQYIGELTTARCRELYQESLQALWAQIS